MEKKRPTIDKEKIIQVNNTKKIDFSKPFKFLYLEWWFYLLTFIPYMICVAIALGAAVYYGLRVKGKKHIKILKKRGHIIISNHCHYFDTVFAHLQLFPKILHVSVVQRNFEVPYIRRILRIVRAFPIPRKNGYAIIAPIVGEALKRNHHIHVLPEGNLVFLSQTIHEFKKGAFYLSYIHQAPILPIVYVLLRKKRFGKQLKPTDVKFTMVFGEPLFPPKLEEGNKIPWDKIKIMSNKSATWMENTIAEYQKEVELIS